MMKKIFCILALALVLIMPLSALGAGITVRLNGEPIDTKDVNGLDVPPFAEDGTTYVPVRAIASALNIKIQWDGDTNTVFIGERGEVVPEKGEVINIYINGKRFVPTDVNGREVSPIAKDGTTYLPVRAIAQAFAKKVDWDGETSSVLIKDSTRIDTGKQYKLVAQGTSSVVTPAGNNSGAALEVKPFDGTEAQLWKFVPVEGEDGFYQLVNCASGCAMDVNGASKSPGAKILQYNSGTGDNQKFMLVANGDDSYKIYSKNSMLPIEVSAGDVKQNSDRTSSVQNWLIESADVSVEEGEDVIEYKNIILKNTTNALTYSLDATDLKAAAYDGSDEQAWELVPSSGGNYAVNTKNGGKGMDVANNSTKEGDPIITYAASSDDNQRWIFEKQSDGCYMIKSVSSGLYLAVGSDGSVVQNGVGDVFEISNAD